MLQWFQLKLLPGTPMAHKGSSKRGKRMATAEIQLSSPLAKHLRWWQVLTNTLWWKQHQQTELRKRLSNKWMRSSIQRPLFQHRCNSWLQLFYIKVLSKGVLELFPGVEVQRQIAGHDGGLHLLKASRQQKKKASGNCCYMETLNITIYNGKIIKPKWCSISMFDYSNCCQSFTSLVENLQRAQTKQANHGLTAWRRMTSVLNAFPGATLHEHALRNWQGFGPERSKSSAERKTPLEFQGTQRCDSMIIESYLVYFNVMSCTTLNNLGFWVEIGTTSNLQGQLELEAHILKLQLRFSVVGEAHLKGSILGRAACHNYHSTWWVLSKHHCQQLHPSIWWWKEATICRVPIRTPTIRRKCLPVAAGSGTKRHVARHSPSCENFLLGFNGGISCDWRELNPQTVGGCQMKINELNSKPWQTQVQMNRRCQQCPFWSCFTKTQHLRKILVISYLRDPDPHQQPFHRISPKQG